MSITDREWFVVSVMTRGERDVNIKQDGGIHQSLRAGGY